MTGKSKLIKTLSVILALVMLLGVMPMGSLVASAAREGSLSYKVSGDKAVIISCDLSTSGDFVIPETIATYPVVGIDMYAFSDCDNLISVTIPDCVETIGSGAFSACDRLAVVKIGKGVTSIRDNAFSNSIALEKIEVAKENKAYVSENGALYNKDKTDLLVFPASNTVESFTVAENVTEIKAGAFLGTKHLKSVVIGDKVTTIGANAFLGSMSLETISLGKSVKTIGTDAFKDCSKLVGFAVSSDNNVLKSDAFGVLYSKDGTQLINYPAGNTSEKYEVAEGTAVINLCAFENVIALKEITIPKSVVEIEPSAFSGCLALSKVKYGGSDVEWGSVQKGTNNESLLGADFEFAGGVQHNHSYTETIYKNADCVNPGEKRFVCECGHYNTEVIPAKGHDFANNYCINCGKKEYELAKDGTKAKITKYNGNATSIVIPSMIDGFAINAIGDNAFENHSQLASITIPDGIVEIGNNAFFGTGYYNTAANWDNGVLYIGKYLIEANSLTVGSSYTVKDGTVLIADYAFNACKALRTITFPAGLKVIGDSAFSQCTSLQTVNCGVKKGEWSSVVIGSDNASLNANTLVFVPDPHVHVYNTVADSKEATCTTAGYKVTKCECGEEIREDYPATGHIFTNNICAGCNGREYEYSVSAGSVTIDGCHESISGTVTIPAVIGGYKVLGIGVSAFANNNRIKNVVIPQGVTTIGANAFYNCDELEIVSVPASVVIINASAFTGCDKLTEISVNALNTSYSSDSNGVLYNAGKTELVCYPSGKTETEYTVADGVMVIGKDAFRKVTALNKITLPASLRTIDDNAFDGCDNIKDVVFGGTETKWGSVVIRANNTAITNATKEFKDTSDADLAKEHAAELHLENATASSTGMSIIITATENADTIEVYPTTLTTKKAVSVKTTGTVVKLTAEGRYEVSFEDCHKTNNETTSTITIAGVTYTVKFVFPRENGGHNYEISEVVAPTCVAAGYTRHFCSICDAYMDDTAVSALGHTYGGWEISVDETCTEKGVKIRKCEACDESTEGHTEIGSVPAKGHRYVVIVVEPTCVDSGYTEYKCKECDYTYTGETFAALGHTYGDWIVVTEATCTDEGLKYKVCSVCDEETEDHEVEEVVEAFGHDYAISVFPPTPTDKGYTYYLCNICGDEKIENELDPIIAIEKITYNPVQIKRDEVVTIVPVLQTVGNKQVDCTVVYQSADPSIATVDEKGNVTGVFNGETTIKCTLTDEFGHTYSAVECKVTVKFTIIQWIIWFFRDFLFGWVSDLF